MQTIKKSRFGPNGNDYEETKSEPLISGTSATTLVSFAIH
jgi:hypothetical protein